MQPWSAKLHGCTATRRPAVKQPAKNRNELPPSTEMYRYDSSWRRPCQPAPNATKSRRQRKCTATIHRGDVGGNPPQNAAESRRQRIVAPKIYLGDVGGNPPQKQRNLAVNELWPMIHPGAVCGNPPQRQRNPSVNGNVPPRFIVAPWAATRPKVRSKSGVNGQQFGRNRLVQYSNCDLCHNGLNGAPAENICRPAMQIGVGLLGATFAGTMA